MLFATAPARAEGLRARIAEHYRADENRCVDDLAAQAALAAAQSQRVETRARDLVRAVRAGRIGKGGVDAFMLEYELSSEEGVVLMCLAEALLRIPDHETANRFIRDKLADGAWEEHLGHSSSLFVNASTWGLMLTGRVVRYGARQEQGLRAILQRLFARGGEPFIRGAVRQAMNIMGRQFVLGRDIDEALHHARPKLRQGYRYSYDMLGEGARTESDARRYFDSYATAIDSLGRHDAADIVRAPGISVKLTALHPRFEFAQRDRIANELVPRVRELALRAQKNRMALTIDAEEAARLEPTLDVFEALASDADLAGWDGLGLAVQAYQKRAEPVLDWLVDLAQRTGRRIPVRLVKGAYWDSEIKQAQVLGLDDYPVFTRKSNTDVSYLACARKLLAHRDVLYPQFATHNAHTVAAVCEHAGDRAGFEFQRLHGMGEALHEQVLDALGIPVRIYAPVGSHEELLPYLVRRLLENGANTSFVNRLVDDRAPIEEIVADPVERVQARENKRHPRIPLPGDLYGADRRNSAGLDLSDIGTLIPLDERMERAAASDWRCAPLIGGTPAEGKAAPVVDPANHGRQIGTVVEATQAHCDRAMELAADAHGRWDATPATERAACLEHMADRLEAERERFMAMAAREGGKNVVDGIAEVREAADFCRYYAARARADFAAPLTLPGPTGEHNEISLHGRGVFVCISPWNFPLAIFTGQIAAALVAGNSVIAKPAEQTPLVAFAAVQAFHDAGIPADALHLIPGRGETVGARLLDHPRLGGVAFTGGVDTAHAINHQLAQRPGPILPLIAETGGQNVMLVDSSALPEQVVRDVIESAFRSAGQRCSALRVLFLQADVADRMIEMLAGAMAELRMGDPACIEHDIGPVIEETARETLEAHAARMEREGRVIARTPLPAGTEAGSFFAPRAYEIERLEQIEGEVFGPILHVIRYRADELDRVLDDINATGYGLTLGIHSRIEETITYIHQRLRVGNTYVNRNQVGSVVGVQPFGGEGLSGTGPKAGGPHYLYRFATERTFTVDTTAQGGNAALLSLDELDMERRTEPPQKGLE